VLEHAGPPPRWYCGAAVEQAPARFAAALQRFGNDSCGVRIHVLADWRFGPAPYMQLPQRLSPHICLGSRSKGGDDLAQRYSLSSFGKLRLDVTQLRTGCC
jgi:hypothetical protein